MTLVVPTKVVGRFVAFALVFVGVISAGSDARAQVGSTAQINDNSDITSGRWVKAMMR